MAMKISRFIQLAKSTRWLADACTFGIPRPCSDQGRPGRQALRERRLGGQPRRWYADRRGFRIGAAVDKPGVDLDARRCASVLAGRVAPRSSPRKTNTRPASR